MIDTSSYSSTNDGYNWKASLVNASIRINVHIPPRSVYPSEALLVNNSLCNRNDLNVLDQQGRTEDVCIVHTVHTTLIK
jgi:hypothetical protein